MRTFPMHASMHFNAYFPCACFYAFHCLLSLRMHLCISLSTFPVHASMHVTIYFPCACIHAFHPVLALRMPLGISLCTFPAHASMHQTVYFPCACLYASDCLLSLRMPVCISLSTFPVHASMHFTVYFRCACIYALHSVLALCIFLSAFPMQLGCAERNDFTGRTLRNTFGNTRPGKSGNYFQTPKYMVNLTHFFTPKGNLQNFLVSQYQKPQIKGNCL